MNKISFKVKINKKRQMILILQIYCKIIKIKMKIMIYNKKKMKIYNRNKIKNNSFYLKIFFFCHHL